MTENVDPEAPRPEGHDHVDQDAEWFFVDDDLAETIALGPATDGEPGDDWVLTLSAATPGEDPAPAERVAVCLTPWALHELYRRSRPSALGSSGNRRFSGAGESSLSLPSRISDSLSHENSRTTP